MTCCSNDFLSTNHVVLATTGGRLHRFTARYVVIVLLSVHVIINLVEAAQAIHVCLGCAALDTSKEIRYNKNAVFITSKTD